MHIAKESDCHQLLKSIHHILTFPTASHRRHSTTQMCVHLSSLLRGHNLFLTRLSLFNCQLCICYICLVCPRGIRLRSVNLSVSLCVCTQCVVGCRLRYIRYRQSYGTVHQWATRERQASVFANWVSRLSL